MRTRARNPAGHIRRIPQEEGHKIFDEEAWRSLNMSGEEFVRKWDAGEFTCLVDDPQYHHKIMRVVMLLPLVKDIRHANGR